MAALDRHEPDGDNDSEAEVVDALSVVDPEDAAVSAGLVYVKDGGPGYTRHKTGSGYFYRSNGGAKNKVTDAAVLRRIKTLVVPPAYEDVWICRRADGHLQVTGRDARGRKQYRYHPRFREVREATKFEHMQTFAQCLPALRATIDKHMKLRGLPREKVLATIVHLLEITLIRVGNSDYARDNKTYGLTTLRGRHVDVEGAGVRFQFKGKSGKEWKINVRDRRAAKIIRQCQDLPGQELFQYLDEEGERRSIDSSDVNAYLKEITERDITAKDFRTWAGTVLAAMALSEFDAIDTQAKAKKNVRAAIEKVASRLGNTATICRKCYIHPEIVNSYMSGNLLLEIKEEVEAELREDLPRLRPEEAAVLALLSARLGAEIQERKVSAS